MTDAPKRIWVKGWSFTGEKPDEIIGTFFNRPPGTEYVRADLVDAAIAVMTDHRDLMRASSNLLGELERS